MSLIALDVHENINSEELYKIFNIVAYTCKLWDAIDVMKALFYDKILVIS